MSFKLFTKPFRRFSAIRRGRESRKTPNTSLIDSAVMSENLLDVGEDDFIVSDVSANQKPPKVDLPSTLQNAEEDTFNINGRLNDIQRDQDPEFMGTLNESVATTLLRDLNHMKTRLLKVLYPNSLKKMFLPMTVSDTNHDDAEHLNGLGEESSQINETSVTDSPEMWAPLLLNLTYSKILSNGNNSFAFFFLLVWGLMCVLSYHLKVYHKISFLGKLSLLLYCFFPVVLNSILIKVFLNPLCLNRFFMKSPLLGMRLLGLFIKIAITSVSTLWCFYSCIAQLWKDFSVSTSALGADDWSSLFMVKNLPVFIVFMFLNWFNVL